MAAGLRPSGWAYGRQLCREVRLYSPYMYLRVCVCVCVCVPYPPAHSSTHPLASNIHHFFHSHIHFKRAPWSKVLLSRARSRSGLWRPAPSPVCYVWEHRCKLHGEDESVRSLQPVVAPRMMVLIHLFRRFSSGTQYTIFEWKQLFCPLQDTLHSALLTYVDNVKTYRIRNSLQVTHRHVRANQKSASSETRL